jgi:antitoxin component YwqK of YwqJK toxin-antitoxin module
MFSGVPKTYYKKGEIKISVNMKDSHFNGSWFYFEKSSDNNYTITYTTQYGTTNQ